MDLQSSSIPVSSFVPQKGMKAWVVFSGQTDMFWLKVLRRGFRHCFLLIHDGRGWVTVDPMLHYLDVEVLRHISPDFDLPHWLCGQGHVVMPAAICRRRRRPAPVAFFTCVETVKRFLGLHHVLIFTPWQLYRYLRKEQYAAAGTNSNIYHEGEQLWVH